MTYKEAKEQGYKVYQTKMQDGYVTRKPRPDDQIEVLTAEGYRKGDLYILMPNYSSTRYCKRCYLRKENK